MTLHQTFQDPCTPVMVAIVEVHSYIIFYLFAIVTFVLVALMCVIYDFYLADELRNERSSSSDGQIQPDMDPKGNPSPPSGGGDDGDWKKKLLLLGAVLGVTLVVLATAGKVGWGDYCACWNRPGEFFGAGVDHGMRLAGQVYDPINMRKYLNSIYPEVWKAAINPEVICAKLDAAKIPTDKFEQFSAELFKLGSEKVISIYPVVATYPEGACQITLRAALEISVNDKIDCLILEYATEYF